VLLVEATLSGSDLSGASLLNANLFQAELMAAKLVGANMREANLFAANLSQSDLTQANLTDAVMEEADLTGAILQDTDLRGTDLTGAKLYNVLYEPINTPKVETLHSVLGLNTLYWSHSPGGMVLLRKALKDRGMREQERQITYSIRRSERLKKTQIYRYIELFLFEIPCAYGLSPFRPLLLLLALIPGFAVVYVVKFLTTQPGGEGIWKIHSGKLGKRKYEDAYLLAPMGISAIGWGIYFSLLSAFQIGWRDVNIGNWISRLSPYHFALEATGWIRVVSGTQSLVTVYLFALWVLSSFARPFD
jgi:hypothetical protein